MAADWDGTKAPTRAVTRRQAQVRKNTYTDLDQVGDDVEDLEAQTEYNETLSKETFLGVKQILERKGIGADRPIIFIVKNIKLFSSTVLNDLIHMLKKYRNQWGLNFCLILGVQNNNKEEIHLKLNIQNCTKLTVKNFYFPSMKNIIFNSIYVMLQTKQSPLTFSSEVIRNLIEQLNIYGTSIDKFRRMLKQMISEFVYSSRYLLVHKALTECDQFDFNDFD